MRHPALIAEGPPHRRGTNTLHPRSLVGQSSLDVEVIHIHVEVPLLGEVVSVLNGCAQHLLDQRRNALLGEGYRVQCIGHAAPLDQFEHQASLLRRYPLKLRFGPEFLCFQLHWFLPLNSSSGAWPTTRPPSPSAP